MSIRTAVAILMLGGLLGASAYAQSGAPVQVSAQAEPMATTVGETITFTVRVEGVPATVVQAPDLPRTVHLEPQREAPKTQQVRSAENGTLRQSVVFSWRLRAQEAGTARIRPVTVVVRGKEYTTSTIRIRVSDVDESRPRLTRPGGKTRGGIGDRDLFVQATASANEVYQNEQVVVEYRLFYRPGIRLRHSRLADSWDAPGFWREALNVASRPTPEPRRVEGRRYETVALKRVALFPTRPGTLRVDPLRIQTEAQGTMREGRGGASLRGRFEPVQLASRRLFVRAQPLPSGAPPSFDGAVGQFSLTARADTDSLTVGEAVSLTVQVTGTGALSTLSPPSLEAPPAVEAYEPTVEAEVDRSGRRIQGTKTFTYMLVPRSAGRHTLPPVSFSYFDPETRRYETLRASVPALRVSGTTAQSPRLSGRTGDGLPVGDVTALMSAAEAQWVRPERPPLYRQRWPYLALLLPLLGAGGGVVYRRWTRATEDASEGPPDTSLDAAQARLREARRHRQNGADAAVYDAVEQSLGDFLDARLGQKGPISSRGALARHLARCDVPEELRSRLDELLDRCDEVQYAPGASSPEALDEILDEAAAVLRRLDKHLPASKTSADSS